MAEFPPDLATFALARPLIQKWEGYSAKPYLCPANKWTIGWGSTRDAMGKPITQNTPAIDQSYAGILLVAAMRRVREDLEPCVTRTPTVHQAAALIVLAYNIGVGLHDGIKGDLADSTLLAKFNAGDIQGAADQFGVWVYIHKNGKAVKLDGLVQRRADEKALFLTPDNLS